MFPRHCADRAHGALLRCISKEIPHDTFRRRSTGSRPGPGRAIGRRTERRRACRPRRRRTGIAGAPGRRLPRGRRQLHALRRVPGPGAGGRRRGRRAVAPPPFQLPPGRPAWGPGVRPGPDLAQGVPLADVPNGGVLAGHVDGEPVLLARLDDGFHAVAGSCTHYGGSLGEGLVVDGEVRCPLHHACFSLRTGAALRAPAFAPLATWHTQVVGDTVFVRAKRDEAPTPAPGPRVDPGAIVIVGGELGRAHV